MNTDNPDNNLEDSGLAYAAISLCGNQTRGAAPEWHELSAWHEGTLTPSRADEVLSHVANDAHYFQQWLDIAEAQSWINEEVLSATTLNQTIETAAHAITDTPADVSPSHTTRPRATSIPSVLSKARSVLASIFQQPIPVYGGAFAAVILAVLVAPLLNTGQALTLQQQMDRSLDIYIVSGNPLTGVPPVPRSTRSLGGLFDELSVSDVERHYLQSGMRQFGQRLDRESVGEIKINDQWTPWLAELPTEPLDCTQAINSTHCTDVADQFMQLGQWALMSAAACQSLLLKDAQPLDGDFWSDQYTLYQALIDQPAIAQSQLLAQSLTTLAVQTPEALCTITASVIATSQ